MPYSCAMPDKKDQAHVFHYFDEFGVKHTITYQPNEYENLMILLLDQCGEEWGDCKGRAWCGTCHIQLLDGKVDNDQSTSEQSTLSKLSNLTNTSRLACQIEANEQLNGMLFNIIGGD